MVAAALLLGSPTAPASVFQEGDDPLELHQLAGMSIEELMTIEVTTVAGIEETWFRTPSAIDVITGDEIRRYGHLTIPEALRMVPGMAVGRINSQSYAIGARGFNAGLANKMLVLIDGRVVYDPLFSGTFWNVQDLVLEDIDRIEVIRGPGATLWGANAVNGVISVITRPADETQGLYISGGAGTEELGFAEARYGGKLGESAWYRVWGQWFERDAFELPDGSGAHDDWDMLRGGFRVDFEGDERTLFTFDGAIYHSERIGERISIPVPGAHLLFTEDIRDGRNSGGHFLFRVRRDDSRTEGWQLQTYYDRTERVTNAGGQIHRDTLDLDFRHWFEAGDSHDLIWGLGARHTDDRTGAGPNTAFVPRARSLDTFSAFIQDTIELVPDRLFFMVGSKFEENDTTGFEVQPGTRLWWTPDDRHTIWAAFSRPVRTPSRVEEDSIITFGLADLGLLLGGPPSGVIIPLTATGNDDLEAEKLSSFELGYRERLTDDLTLDLATFYNDYQNLIFLPTGAIGQFNNDGEAETYGAELAMTWQAADNWRLEASYSYVDVQVHGPIFTFDELITPHHQAQLRSHLRLTDEVDLNGALYYVDSVPQFMADSYWRLDLGLIWRPTDQLEIALWGQNLLDELHNEASGSLIERSAYLRVTMRF